MGAAAPWVVPTPAAKYRLDAGAPASHVDTPLPSVAGPGSVSAGPVWHPDSPLFWFGVVAAATFGLLAVSTSVRVGPVRAAVSAGKS